MLDVHILNSDNLEVIGVVHDYNTYSTTINYNKVGSFLLSIDNRLDNSKEFVKDRIVMLGDNGLYTGIITNITIEIDDEGNETRTVKGKTLGHILSHRVTNANGINELNFEQGSAEQIIKSYVTKNAVSAYNEKRNYKNLAMGKNRNLGRELRWQTKFETLLDVVEEISDYENLGWNIRSL